jgi:hypothetical protein
MFYQIIAQVFYAKHWGYLVCLIQIHGLNAGCLILAHCSQDPRAGLLSDQSLVTRVLDLLNDARRPYVAAKALLMLSLLVDASSNLLLVGCELHMLTRFLRLDTAAWDTEPKEYVQQCQAVLRTSVLRSVPLILHQVCSSHTWATIA